MRIGYGILAVVSVGTVYPCLQAQTLLIATPDVTVNFDFASKPFPVWSGGALLVREGHGSPVVNVLDESGTWENTVTFTIPDAATIETFSVARGPAGELAMCGLAISSSGKVAPYLALSSADGKSQQIFRTDPFWPDACAIAGDGTIWAAGKELVSGREANFDHGMVRQFDQTGHVINSLLPRSLYPTKGIVPPPTGSKLVSGGSRIGWYSPSTQDYFEIANGQVTRVSAAAVLEPADYVNAIALTDNGRAFLGVLHQKEHTWGIAVLNSGAWTQISPATGWENVYGAFGNIIIAGTKNVLRFYQFSATE